MPSASALPGETGLFDGPPDPAVKLGAEVAHARLTLRTPPGWRQPFILSGSSWIASPDGDAAVLVYTSDTDKVGLPANLSAPLGTSTVKWSAPASAKIGQAHAEARVENGGGKLGAEFTEYSHGGAGTPWVMSNEDKMDKDDADLWRIVLAEADRGKSYVLLAALKKKGEARRAELVACVRSLVWK